MFFFISVQVGGTVAIFSIDSCPSMGPGCPLHRAVPFNKHGVPSWYRHVGESALEAVEGNGHCLESRHQGEQSYWRNRTVICFKLPIPGVVVLFVIVIGSRWRAGDGKHE